MAADFQAIDVLAFMVGVVDGPARQPQNLAFELGEQAQVVAIAEVLIHRGGPVQAIMSRRAGKEMPNMADRHR